MHKDRKYEKSSNFGKAMARLVKELKKFNILIIISIILSVAGSTLEIIAPDEMSKLTDQIAKGLIVNTDNIEKINKTITNNVKKVMPNTNTSNNADVGANTNIVNNNPNSVADLLHTEADNKNPLAPVIRDKNIVLNIDEVKTRAY